MGRCFTLHLLPFLDRLFLSLATNRCWILDIRSGLFTSFNLIMLLLIPMVHATTGRSFPGKIIYTHSPNALARELIERPSDGYPGKLRDVDKGTNVMRQKLRPLRIILI